MGRPKIKLRPSDYPRLEAMASVGASIATCAKRLGFSRKTLDRILKEDAKARDAFSMGRGELESALARSLYETAMDRTDPKSTTAAIYLTKAMCRWTDQPQPQVGEESRVRLEIVLPKSLTEAEYMKVVDVLPSKAKQLKGAVDAG